MRNDSKWMHPREFIPNNVEYRISACSAINNFKRNQEFILKQIAFNPFHKFSNLAKEILLLKYDIWYDFINECEQYILCNISLSSEEILKEIIKLLDQRVEYYDKILDKMLKTNIEERYVIKWKAQHHIIYKYLVKKIIGLSKQKTSILFTSLIYLLNDVMAHTLYELQELDILIFSDDEIPSLNIDNLSIYLSKNTNYLIDKLINYKNIRNFDKVIIKNQTDTDLEISYPKFFIDLREILDIKYIII